MYISDIFETAQRLRRLPVSFEMFPPKGELTLERAREVAASFAPLGPDFISVTYSAGGSGNNAATTQIAQMIDTELAIPSVAHLTCISLKRADLAAKIDEMRAAGVETCSRCAGMSPKEPRPARAAPISAMRRTSSRRSSRRAFASARRRIRKATWNATTSRAPCAISSKSRMRERASS